ncbi:hypothetical protein HPB47_021561 [Ixodes persulcatus]|uniref:Uncharacterized protein n=1 Tax=Ixodes persulcatus TaxID=34615 RepID=A0AC60QFF8_IXOPE|nr:hypothetical protein HPB47_021561 [Ixodes persulcatus]
MLPRLASQSPSPTTFFLRCPVPTYPVPSAHKRPWSLTLSDNPRPSRLIDFGRNSEENQQMFERNLRPRRLLQPVTIREAQLSGLNTCCGARKSKVRVT